VTQTRQTVDVFFFLGLPQYFPWNLYYWTSATFGKNTCPENGLFVPLFATVFIAIIGSVYVSWIASPAKFKMGSVALLLGFTISLGVLTAYFWMNYRECILAFRSSELAVTGFSQITLRMG